MRKYFILKCFIVLYLLQSPAKVSCADGDSKSTSPSSTGSNGFEINFQDPNTCQRSQNETFSSIRLGCVKCQNLGTTGRGNGYINCPCPEQHYYTSSSSGCVPCINGTISHTKDLCIPCSEEFPYDTLTMQCKSCPTGSIQVLNERSGSPSTSFNCLQCASGFTPSQLQDECIPCHPSFLDSINGTCKCPELTHSIVNGICSPNEIQDVNTDTIYKISYDNGQIVDSAYLRQNLLAAYYSCKANSNETACQILANSCVLQLYNPNENEMTACRLYRTIQGSSVNTLLSSFSSSGSGSSSNTRINTIPSLFFNEPILLLQRTDLIPYEFNTNFEKSSSDVNITIARFNINGEFLGLKSLHEIIPCPEKKQVQKIQAKFGTTISTKCMIPLKDLWEKYNNNDGGNDGEKHEMEFLEAYLSHLTTNEFKLHSIPLKILNIKKNGQQINTLQEVFQWVLVKRFFFMDTIGGFEGTSGITIQQEARPKVIRYLESIRVDIQLQPSSEPGRIFIPIITLKYSEASADHLLKNEMVQFTLDIDYSMDMTRSLEDIKIAIGVISSLSVIWAAIQTWGWNRRNGKIEIDIETIINLLVSCFGSIADSFFIVCICTALYWFIFFKKQVAVHVLLPQITQEKLVRDLIISAFALKIVDIVRLIWRQVTIDIFLIDWEKPRVLGTLRSKAKPPTSAATTGSSLSAGSTGGIGIDEQQLPNVSIWRTYFVANEWNEIQSTRIVHFATHIIVVLFFLEIIGFKYLGLYWANNDLSPGIEAINVPYSSMARFVIGTLVFGIAGFIQWVYKVAFHERFISNKIQDFVDICTLSNISVFILAAQQYGFYIHGRSVHGFSDTDMHTMIDQLHREEEDLCGRRGLVPSTDQQTFLISVPKSFRLIFNRVLEPLYAAGMNVRGRGRGRSLDLLTGNKSATAGNTSGKLSSGQLSMSTYAYHSMNRFLTTFLEHALSDLDYEIANKTFFELTLDMEFKEVSSHRAVFYNDNGHSFDSVLLYGNERTLFLFDLYLFVFVDILSHNFVLAGIVTYLVDLIIKSIRYYFGKSNFARKTLIDKRFLI